MSDLAKWENKTPSDIIAELNIKELPVDPFDIAARIGVVVKKDIDWEKMDADGEIYINESGKPEIWINPMMHPNRQNFTLAHEIGHLTRDLLPNIGEFKALQDNYSTLQRNGAKTYAETMANIFASKLLMPEDLIVKYGQEIVDEYKKEKNKDMPIEKFIPIIANKAHVSAEAMRYRLKKLGII
ncbi:MAG: ImmA/IrrE family metallo-endopeptidase [Helicobacteraceae bacterium]|jgi:Zn-dependent peptidase ImmA (M78 family)|nr:ImmA/IrrE family metallo-endopeptidase [Helicobacteraceae bacterium]